MTLSIQEQAALYIDQAYKADRKTNETQWIRCLWASKVVGNKKLGYGATISLAQRLNREVDSCEDYAHAYRIFEELITAHDNLYRRTVFAARRAPYIHYSHFRVLYEAREKYNLTIEQVFMYLMDVIQAEGDLSARGLDNKLKSKHDKDLNWEWYAKNTLKAIAATLQQPDLPDDLRDVLTPAFEKLGDK